MEGYGTSWIRVDQMHACPLWRLRCLAGSNGLKVQKPMRAFFDGCWVCAYSQDAMECDMSPFLSIQ